ncbi:MAG: UbiA family prenyltransferase [Planctomycetes bacterium]|nr:UbiA family prenyltransferase [Planctomycetota bacterium]
MPGAFSPTAEMAQTLRDRAGLRVYARLAGGAELPATAALACAMLVVAAAQVGRFESLPRQLALLAMGALLLQAATSALQQRAQVDCDRINDPGLPLCTGELTAGRAGLFAAVTGMLGALSLAVLMLQTGRWLAAVPLIAWIGARSLRALPATARWARAWPWSVLLSVLEGAALAFGAGVLAGGLTTPQIWVLSALAGMLWAGGGLLRDMQAQRGDATYGVATLPAVHGQGAAAAAAAWLVALPYALLAAAAFVLPWQPAANLVQVVVLGAACLFAGLRVGLLALAEPDAPGHRARHEVVVALCLAALAVSTVPYSAWGRWIGVLA